MCIIYVYVDRRPSSRSAIDSPPPLRVIYASEKDRSRRTCDRIEQWLTRDSSGDGHVTHDEQSVNIKNVILTSIANCIHIITIPSHRSSPKWTVGSDRAGSASGIIYKPISRIRGIFRYHYRGGCLRAFIVTLLS